MFLNGSFVEVNARQLSDGGLLIRLDDKSHLTYAKEDVSSTRVMIDGKTCMIEKENDPTKLRAPSPGKLVRFVVEDGDHIEANQPFAEIEVMKMYMSLVASEAGHVRFIAQPGSVVNPGDLIGILTLDDPSRVKHAVPFDGQLPKVEKKGTSDTINNIFLSQFLLSLIRIPVLILNFKMNLYCYLDSKRILELILQGYDIQSKMQESMKLLSESLKNPQLPYLEIYVRSPPVSLSLRFTYIRHSPSFVVCRHFWLC